MIILFGRETQRWTQQAKAILKIAGWKYKFVPAESCNGRDYNLQGIKTVPTLKVEMEKDIFLTAEGIDAIDKIVPKTGDKVCTFRF